MTVLLNQCFLGGSSPKMFFLGNQVSGGQFSGKIQLSSVILNRTPMYWQWPNSLNSASLMSLSPFT